MEAGLLFTQKSDAHSGTLSGLSRQCDIGRRRPGVSDSMNIGHAL